LKQSHFKKAILKLFAGSGSDEAANKSSGRFTFLTLSFEKIKMALLENY